MPTPPIYSSPALGYASDASYSVEGDPYDNSAVQVQPSPTQITQGMRPARQVPAQGMNWILGQFALIFDQLISDVTNVESEIATIDTEQANHETRITTLETDWSSHTPRIKVYGPFTSSTTWQPGARVLAALAIGCGGGGGGGFGAYPTVTSVVNNWLCGAAGGGGASLGIVPLVGLDPTQIYNIDIGAGGVGATSGSGGAGGDGGDSVIRLSATRLAVFPGAGGGQGAPGGPLTGTSMVQFVWGGGQVRGVNRLVVFGTDVTGIMWDMAEAPFNSAFVWSLQIPVPPGMGGPGAGGQTQPVAPPGQMNTFGGFLGGAQGPYGVALSTAQGGGPGGGGGAGPFGPGGNGGGGVNAATNHSSQVAQNAVGVGTGAGGGGSGSASYNSGTTPTIDPAGNGSGGRVYIITVEES